MVQSIPPYNPTCNVGYIIQSHAESLKFVNNRVRSADSRVQRPRARCLQCGVRNPRDDNPGMTILGCIVVEEEFNPEDIAG